MSLKVLTEHSLEFLSLKEGWACLSIHLSNIKLLEITCQMVKWFVAGSVEERKVL